jgi:hypothetical protein
MLSLRRLLISLAFAVSAVGLSTVTLSAGNWPSGCC